MASSMEALFQARYSRTTTELKNKSEEGKVFPPVFLKDKINIKVITVLKHLKHRKKKRRKFFKITIPITNIIIIYAAYQSGY